MKRVFQHKFNPTKRHIPYLSNRPFFTLSTTMPPSYKRRQIVPKINLNGTETKIRNLLVEFCDVYNQSEKYHSNNDEDKLVLRITGGWVRDKLLGDESNDLDIAINHISGEMFTNELVAYIKSRYSDHNKEIMGTSIHKIDKNPEKSKHLETCTTKLYGLDIDFVNLRNEEYTEESRIPTITYGTATEDAFRRDATLNALFYNLTTQEVEDFTGRGIDDLNEGILRTPLPAKKTFLDDPLRALRLIRFAARFGFEIDSAAMQAMKDPAISGALKKKISRERVGVEVHKMLQGPNPEYGLELVFESHLFESIFNLGDNSDIIMDLNTSLKPIMEDKIAECNTQIGSFPDKLPFIKQQLSLNAELNTAFQQDIMQDKQQKKNLYLALILQPWHALKVVANPKKLKNEMLVTELIMRDGLKFSAKESEAVSLVVSSSDDFIEQMNKSLDPQQYKRSELGLMMMKKYDTIAKWQLAFFSNLCYSLISTSVSKDNTECSQVMRDFVRFHGLVKSEKLDTVWDLKPLLDGKTILKELNLKPGPWMKQISVDVVTWQLDHPDGDRDACLKFISEKLN